MLTGSEELNELTGSIIGAAMDVHTKLGPGLLEHTYLSCLRYELMQRGFEAEGEVLLDLTYGQLVIPNAYRLDLVVDNQVIVELSGGEDFTTTSFSIAHIPEAQSKGSRPSAQL